jgi:hypothetical protein
VVIFLSVLVLTIYLLRAADNAHTALKRIDILRDIALKHNKVMLSQLERADKSAFVVKSVLDILQPMAEEWYNAHPDIPFPVTADIDDELARTDKAHVEDGSCCNNVGAQPDEDWELRPNA